MSHTIVTLLISRYLYQLRREKNISLIFVICFCAIALGTCLLALIFSIMRGFEKVTLEKLQGVNAHIVIRGDGNALNVERIDAVAHAEFPEIVATSPVATAQVMIQSGDEQCATTAVFLKGIDPERENRVTNFNRTLSSNEGNDVGKFFQDHDALLIGTSLAQELTTHEGDKVTLFFVADESLGSKKINLDAAQACVSGIFKTGIDEFDNGIIYCSLSYFQMLFPQHGVDQINVRLSDSVDGEAVAQRLRERFGLTVHTWHALYPALVAALRLETMVMVFIGFLVLLIATMNIISVSCMVTLSKRADIAILKSMGMTETMVERIFMGISVVVACVASFFGLSCAALLGFFLQRFPLIQLPDMYLLTELPVVLEPLIFCGIFIFVIGVSVLAAWIPARQSRSVAVTDLLRFES